MPREVRRQALCGCWVATAKLHLEIRGAQGSLGCRSCSWGSLTVPCPPHPCARSPPAYCTAKGEGADFITRGKEELGFRSFKVQNKTKQKDPSQGSW